MEEEATFFETPAAFRAWLAEHHETASEIWVGYYKKATGKPTMTWVEAVEEALCYGWIDGKRQRIDDERHRQRFTPRRRGSNWSAVNVAKVAELRAQGRMTPAGEAAFAARRDDPSAVYSYERRHEAAFDAEQEAELRANPAAWEWFDAQPPSYRTMATFWVVSAKRPETRARRLATLVECSAEGRRVPPLAS
ncbi:MAG: YdeI/OmpD-associated family protein [Actinomycetota bacterium]|nr:YdeI/OmpD-associated family protein [Actinomycetota bacterium]